MTKRKSDSQQVDRHIENLLLEPDNNLRDIFINSLHFKRAKFADVTLLDSGKHIDLTVLYSCKCGLLDFVDISGYVDLYCVVSCTTQVPRRVHTWDSTRINYNTVPGVHLPLYCSMPGNRNHTEYSQHGSPTINTELFAQIKDITKIQSNTRRLNDYTTIPRRPRSHPRSHPRNGEDYVLTTTTRDKTIKIHEVDDQVKSISRDEIHKPNENQSTCPVSSHDHRKDKTWSFKKLKNALKRSKSLKSEDIAEKDSDSSGSSDSKVSESTLTLRRSQTCVKDSKPDLSKYMDNEDPYADIDSLQLSGHSLRKNSDCASCRSGHSGSHKSGHSGSDSNMSATFPACSRPSSFGQEQSESSQKTGVFKALSSLTIRNLSTKKKTTRKTRQDQEYDANEFHRDHYRGSFKDTAIGCRLSDTQCKRSKSFTSPTSEKPARNFPCPVSPAMSSRTNTGIYSKQTEYETRDSDVLYSLAQADDQPPPLPERTYLKLRKENHDPDDPYKRPIGQDSHTRISFPLQEQNNNYKPAAYPNTIPEHVRLHAEKPVHGAKSRRRQNVAHDSAKPFMLHSHLRQEGDRLSSGYGSVNSDTFSTASDYSQMPPPPPPPPVCTLPKRSRQLLSRGLLASLATNTLPGHYTNKEEESQQSDSLRRDSQKSDEDETTDYNLTSNVIHNLPLPPGPGGAQLIRTLQLDSVLKNKWISGIAVTKKNEYIVVDQREAYLLDENGALKKTIGAKGSNRLIEPFDVCVCPSNGHLVICDHADQDVKVFSWKGQFLKRVKDPGLTNIAGVSVTDSRDIVIAGTDKQRLSIISEDGRLKGTIPSTTDDSARSRNRTPFEHPYSVAVNPLSGDVIIGDDYRQLVTAVAPDRDGRGTRVLWRYCPGPGDRHFFPSSICADSKGYIFIADLYNEKVYMLDSGGKFVKTLLSRGDGLKGGPGAIATDGRGHLLVADEEKVIKIFKYRDEKGFAVNKRYSYCPQAT